MKWYYVPGYEHNGQDRDIIKERNKTIIWLHYKCGMPIKRIAKYLDRHPQTIRGIIKTHKDTK